MAGKKRGGSERPNGRQLELELPKVVEEVVTEGKFSVEKFVECFPIMVEAAGGIAGLRVLVLHGACHGRMHQGVVGSQPSAALGPQPLPAGWEWRFLGTVASRISNGLSKKQTRETGPHPVTRIETIASGRIDLSRVGYAGACSADEVSKYRLDAGDILFSHINSVPHLGKTALVEAEHVAAGLLHGTNLILIRPDRRVIEPGFLHLVLQLHRATGRTARDAQHAIQQASINQGVIRDLEVPLPPLVPKQANKKSGMGGVAGLA